MGSVNKNKITNVSFSKIKRNISNFLTHSKIYQYIKAFFHIILKIQPFFSIFIAILIVVPLSNFFTHGIDTLAANRQNSEYKEGVIGNLKNIDPLPLVPLDHPFSQLNRDITKLIFYPLFASDISGISKGVLVDKYDIRDNGLTYLISLKDRSWSDGEKIKSDDVINTFNTIKDQGSSGFYYPAIDGVDIKKIDDFTFTFNLTTPNSSFLDNLYWPILPSSELTKDYNSDIAGSLGLNPISSTGWNIENINESSISLKNNTTQKDLTFIFYKNTSELEDALNAGFIDGYYSLNPIKPKNFEQINEFNLPRQVYSLYFNLSDSGSTFLKDPNIRKAISYGLDRSEIVGDLGKVRQSVIQEDSWAFNPNVDTYKYDLKKANDILDVQGFKFDGDYRKQGTQIIEFTLSIPELTARLNQANIIQNQLKKIGIKVDIKAIKDSQYIDNELKGNLFYKSIVLTKNFDSMIYSVDSTLDPDKFTQWHSSKIPNIDKNILGLNFSGYSNVRVDAYLRQGRNSTDQNIRKQPYMQFQKVFYDDAPVVTLYSPYVYYVSNKKVENIDFSNVVRVEDRFNNFVNWKY